MTSDLMPEIEDALDTWQEGLSQFMYGPAERERLTAILRAKLFAFTRPTAPTIPSDLLPKCWHCKHRIQPDEPYLDFNIAPAAASGGSMVTAHTACHQLYTERLNTRPAPALPEIVAAAEAWVGDTYAYAVSHKKEQEERFELHKKADAARARFLALVAAHAAEVERLRNGVTAIKLATVEGRVCDDVAWFDTITTLYDFCDELLRPCASATHEKMEG